MLNEISLCLLLYRALTYSKKNLPHISAYDTCNRCGKLICFHVNLCRTKPCKRNKSSF